MSDEWSDHVKAVERAERAEEMEFKKEMNAPPEELDPAGRLRRSTIAHEMAAITYSDGQVKAAHIHASAICEVVAFGYDVLDFVRKYLKEKEQ